jgi:beta-lactam-binding protein with PASTA domain
MSLQPGDLVGDRYELGRQLGAGGMARVFLAHDRLLDRQVAVKVLSDPYASDPQFVERFRREASAAAGLNHPNIVAVYDRGEADGSYYIVMEYMSGPDLKRVIRARAPLPPVEAIDYAQQILAALGAAHRRDVIHRDVKPQNVLVAEDGHLKVTDFGIARAGADGGITEAGSVIGTAQYLSPEQARGDEVTAASDCYAVGIVLYEMLTGRVPFDGERAVTVAMKQINDPPTPPRALEGAIPIVLEDVVLRSLAKRPSERYRTAEEMSLALGEARAAIESGGTTRVLPVSGPPTAQTRVTDPVTGQTRVGPPPPRQPPAPRRRRRWPVIAGILVLLAIVAAGAFALLSGDDGTPVTIPPVAGRSAAEAEQTLRDAGLDVTRQSVEDAQVPVGTAIRTDPAAGEQVSEGDTVILVVSAGPGQTAVPDVVGEQEDAARAELARAEFKVKVTPEASDDVEEGTVIRQDPEADQQATRGSTVTIVVSSGPENLQVPDVRRRPQSEAEQLLVDRGFAVGTVSTTPSTSFDPGIVVRQDPAPNASRPRGTAVNITVAVAPANVPVPNVIGNSAEDALFKLEQAGFRVTSDTADSGEEAGTVIDTAPAVGTPVAPGSTVVITVSNGPSGDTSGDGGFFPPGDGDSG